MKKEDPILSIAVITYNQRALLEKTIDSILSQETMYSFEILICDDASTDDTQARCELYEKTNHETIRYLRLKQNSGITANSNQGITHATGKYFALVGGDDIFLPGKIQKHINYMEINPDVSLSYHPVEIFDSDSDKTLLTTNLNDFDTPKTLLELVRTCIPGSVSVISRSSALPKNGFDNRLPTVSDWLYYIEVASQGTIGFLPEVLARYRKHGNQASYRTYELLDESLLNLDIAKEKLGHIEGLDEAINQGKARYLSGEGYRQLMSGDRTKSRELIKHAISLDFKLLYLLGYISTFLLLPTQIFTTLRYNLKKFF